MFALNAPYNGGTHLPDITVCTPVFDEHGRNDSVLDRLARPSRRYRRNGARIDVAACDSIQEEGVYIDNFLLVERGRFRERELYDLLRSGPYPARNPLQNVNDLKAQIAANEKGVRELRRMVEMFSLQTVEAYMGHVQDNADESVRRVIDRLADGEATSFPTRARSSRSGSASTRRGARRRSISPALRRSSRRTSTRRSR